MSFERQWRNNDGSLKSDEELKVICQNWNAETWENYLSEYTYAQRESCQSTNYIDRTSLESFITFVADSNNENKYPHLRNLFLAASKKLSDKERTVIKMIYHEGYSVSEIRKKLNVKSQSISISKRRALNKIQDIITQKCIANSDIRDWFRERKYL